jgi:hypothetical protein
MGRFNEGNPILDGRFLFTVDKRRKDAEDSHIISGTIEDCLGESVFMGSIRRDYVQFTKQYLSINSDPLLDEHVASKDPIYYEGKRIDDGHNVRYEGTFRDASARPNPDYGTFILIGQGALMPLSITQARLRAAWAAARRIKTYEDIP